MKQFFLATTITLFALVACNDTTPDNTEGDAAAQTEAASENPTAINTAEVKNMMPSFMVEDAGGRLINLQSLQGKKVFVNLWATWCPPCRREMPSIDKLSKATDTSKVAFVMLSLDDNFDKAKKYRMSSGLSLPVYYPAEKLPVLFNVQGIPATFIFNESGELVHQVEGSDDYDTKRYRDMFN